MPMVARITEIDPAYGVLAEATVTVDNIYTIDRMRLHRSDVYGKYRVEIPVSSTSANGSAIKVDKEMKDQVLEAMVSQYEKRPFILNTDMIDWRPINVQESSPDAHVITTRM